MTWSVRTGLVEQVNDAAQDFYGAERISRAALRIQDLLNSREHEPFDSLPPARVSVPLRTGVWLQHNKDGEQRAVEMLIRTIRRDESVAAVAVMVNHTERRIAQLALEASREPLRQAHKMEARGTQA